MNLFGRSAGNGTVLSRAQRRVRRLSPSREICALSALLWRNPCFPQVQLSSKVAPVRQCLCVSACVWQRPGPTDNRSSTSVTEVCPANYRMLQLKHHRQQLQQQPWVLDRALERRFICSVSASRSSAKASGHGPLPLSCSRVHPLDLTCLKSSVKLLLLGGQSPVMILAAEISSQWSATTVSVKVHTNWRHY